MGYERHHIADISIEDEQRSHNGRGITVFVDSLEMVNIEIDDSLTIRTDEQGLEALRHLLHDASVRLDNIRHQNVSKKLGAMTREAHDIAPKKRSEDKSIDLWNSDDPVNW
jgi:hypothetical protein